MALLTGLQQVGAALVDGCFAVLPQPRPPLEKLRRCKLVSHRGEHDNVTVFENTLAAFDAVLARGVWGLECDLRWTRDLQPVVFHDPDCRRLFGSRLRIDEVTLAQLRAAMPLIPTLAEVVARYGTRMHLMLEVKEPLHPDRPQQRARLAEILAPLVPAEDYHILALAPELLQHLDVVPPRAQLLVSELNFRRLSRRALAMGIKGLAGHYWFLSGRYLERHHRAGQAVGTGFIRSERALLREINRGVDWVFTNHALKLQAILDRLTS